MLLFAGLLALVCGLAFGVFPAIQLSRLDLHGVTKEGHGTGGKGWARLRSSLVVAEVALALGRGNVNILDMALYPTQDRSSGSIALWIAGDAQAATAERLMAALDLPVVRT